MSHLNLETIARIADEGPSIEENRHLDACSSCRAELDAMREDIHALAMLPAVTPAPDQWDVIEQRLRHEGLIRTPARPAAWWSRTHVLQAAAALVLFAGGTAAGRMSASPAPSALADADSRPQPGTSLATSPGQTSTAADASMTMPASGERSDAGDASVRLAASGMPDGGHTPAPGSARHSTRELDPRELRPRNVDEAAALLRQTEDLYLTALTRYAEMRSQSQEGDPVARLAALQTILMTTQAALSQAPTDPVINGYHLTALAQRDATLRQVAANSSERWY